MRRGVGCSTGRQVGPKLHEPRQSHIFFFLLLINTRGLQMWTGTVESDEELEPETFSPSMRACMLGWSWKA